MPKLSNLVVYFMEYAIVDIETTGGFGAKNKITEIAIIIHDGERELDRYSTLVDPDAFIPQNITALTGITNAMVEGAPQFHDVAKKVWEMTEGRTFVAHNVGFDYNIIKNEFKDLGAKYQRKKLCTIRLAKKIFPGKPSYSLGNLCESLGIPLQNRHRALGDTEATALLFKILLSKNDPELLEKELKTLNKEAKLPAKLPVEVFDNLPDKCGVYYFYNDAKDVIYVGKAKNIKKRITQHFTNVDSTTKKNNMLSEIANISFEETGSELIALLKESEEIKVISPKFNRAQKRIRFNIGVIQYQDQNGYIRLGIDKKSALNVPSYLKFSTHNEARQFLHKLVEKGELCQKLVGLQTGDKGCFEHQLKMCKGACVKKESANLYNHRLLETLDSFSLAGDSYLVKDIGRDIDEYSAVWVQNGEYKGFGFFSHDIQDPQMIKEGIKVAMDNRDVIRILKSFLSKSYLKVIPLENTPQSGMLF